VASPLRSLACQAHPRALYALSQAANPRIGRVIAYACLYKYLRVHKTLRPRSTRALAGHVLSMVLGNKTMKKTFLTVSALALCRAAGSAPAKEYKALRFGDLNLYSSK
jgi:histidine transport system substrate-binding protein